MTSSYPIPKYHIEHSIYTKFFYFFYLRRWNFYIINVHSRVRAKTKTEAERVDCLEFIARTTPVFPTRARF